MKIKILFALSLLIPFLLANEANSQIITDSQKMPKEIKIKLIETGFKTKNIQASSITLCASTAGFNFEYDRDDSDDVEYFVGDNKYRCTLSYEYNTNDEEIKGSNKYVHRMHVENCRVEYGEMKAPNNFIYTWETSFPLEDDNFMYMCF